MVESTPGEGSSYRRVVRKVDDPHGAQRSSWSNFNFCPFRRSVVLFVLVTSHPPPPGDCITPTVVAGDTRYISPVVWRPVSWCDAEKGWKMSAEKGWKMSVHSGDYRYACTVTPGNRFCSVHEEWFSKLKFSMDLYNPSADTGIVATWLHVVSYLS